MAKSLRILKSFYDYVNNHIVTTDFTKQIDDEISYLKPIRTFKQ